MSKICARLLLFVFFMHAFSVHSFAESLVYCFESNGEVNVESTGSISFGFAAENKVHEHNDHPSHDYQEPVFHAENDQHSDIPLTLSCAKDDRVNRFDQQKTIADLKNAVSDKSEIISPSRSFQRVVFVPPVMEFFITTNLQTVVLLN